MINPVTGQPVPELCQKKDCKKHDRCMLKIRVTECEHYEANTCFECIYMLHDAIDSIAYCDKRIISDIQGYGDIRICENFRRRNHG